jgi:hypothetical protein
MDLSLQFWQTGRVRSHLIFFERQDLQAMMEIRGLR